ncbi:uncharacterized protein LOC144433745 [Glandiceps talaboti]
MAEVTTQLISTILANATNVTVPTPTGPNARAKRLIMANQACITIALILIMVGMGCTITLKEVWKNLRRPVGIVIGVCCQFILMPFLGWSLAHIFQLSPGLALGTLAIATCPGGAMSNLLTFWTNGDTCLSICMTTCSTVIGIGMMPLNLFIYSRSWAKAAAVIPYVDIIIALVVILIPGSLGMLIKFKLPKWSELIAKICSLSSLLFIMIVLCLIATINPALFLSSWKPYIVAVVYPMLSFAFGLLIPWLFRQSPPQRRTIAFETGVQNGALALTIINLMMARGVGNPEMAVVPSLHSVFVMIEGLVFVGIYQLYTKYVKPEEEEEKEMDPVKENEEFTKDEWTWPGKLRNGGIDNPALSYGNGTAVYVNDVDIKEKEDYIENKRGDARYQGRQDLSRPPGYQDIWSWSTGRGDYTGGPVSMPAPVQRDSYPDHRHGRSYGNEPRSPTSSGYGRSERDSDIEYRPNRNGDAYPRYNSYDRNQRMSTEGWSGEPPYMGPGYARRHREEDHVSSRYTSSPPRDFRRDHDYDRYPQNTGYHPQDDLPNLQPGNSERYPEEQDLRSRDTRDYSHPSYRNHRQYDQGHQTQNQNYGQRPRQNVYSIDDQWVDPDKKVNREPRPLRPSATFPRRQRGPIHHGEGEYPGQRNPHYTEDAYNPRYGDRSLHTRKSEFRNTPNDYQSDEYTENERPQRPALPVGDYYRDGRSSTQTYKPNQGRSFNTLPSLPSRILQRNDERTHNYPGPDLHFQYPDT